MPFTAAHPAIVLPLLKRRWFSALGLVIGSVAPDFEYFFKMQVSSVHSHTLPGVLYFDLPVTFFLAWLFLRVVKANLFANLPPFFQRRLGPMTELDASSVFGNWPMFALSAVMGSLSHLFWDGFTHGNTFFVRNLSFYDGAFIPFNGVKYPLWYALQHISTVIGLAVVLIYILCLPPHDRGIIKPVLSYWFVVLTTAAILFVIRFQIWPRDLKEGNAVVSAISGLCCGVVVAGLMSFNNAVQRTERQDG